MERDKPKNLSPSQLFVSDLRELFDIAPYLELENPDKYHLQTDLRAKQEIFLIEDRDRQLRTTVLKPLKGAPEERWKSVQGDGERVFFRARTRALNGRPVVGIIKDNEVIDLDILTCEVSSERLTFVVPDGIAEYRWESGAYSILENILELRTTLSKFGDSKTVINL